MSSLGTQSTDARRLLLRRDVAVARHVERAAPPRHAA
jgi:hypothetical protein